MTCHGGMHESAPEPGLQCTQLCAGCFACLLACLLQLNSLGHSPHDVTSAGLLFRPGQPGQQHQACNHATGSRLYLDVEGGLQHAAVLDELGHNAGHHIDGDGKAHASPGAGGGEHGRVDPDHPPS